MPENQFVVFGEEWSGIVTELFGDDTDFPLHLMWGGEKFEHYQFNDFRTTADLEQFLDGLDIMFGDEMLFPDGSYLARLELMDERLSNGE